MDDNLASHLASVTAMLKRGKVVPFLGAGVNVWNRGDGEWDPYSGQHLPSGAELASFLASEFRPASREPVNLEQIALDICIDPGEASLYGVLRDLFDADYPPNALHHLLAQTPQTLREKGWRPMEVVVTTNYDDCLERAFRDEGVEPHVLTYLALGDNRGRFLHRQPGGEKSIVQQADTYLLPIGDDGRLPPTILKLHGAVDRVRDEYDSYVITEDHYIEFLAMGDITAQLPRNVLARLADSHFLFLGYSLRDWNVRAVLHRLWSAQKADRGSWAIQFGVDTFDIESWRARGVRIMDIPLDEYVGALSNALTGLRARRPVA